MSISKSYLQSNLSDVLTCIDVISLAIKSHLIENKLTNALKPYVSLFFNKRTIIGDDDLEHMDIFLSRAYFMVLQLL